MRESSGPANALPTKGWLDPALLGPPAKLPHFGWLDRVNGPVDNPRSSCLSCHMTAQWPMGAMAPTASMTPELRQSFFQNIKAPRTFTAGRQSLDFSLQLAMGIRNFPGTLSSLAVTAEAMEEFHLRTGDPEESREGLAVGAGPDDPADAAEGYADGLAPRPVPRTATDESSSGLWVLVAIVGVALALLLALARGSRSS